MRKGTIDREAPGGSESLEDLVYRPSISTGNRKVRGGNPWLTIPFTVLGYAALAFLGWLLVRHSKALVQQVQHTVTVDLQDAGEGDAPQAVAPPAPPPAAGGPPAGAIEKAEAPPPPVAATSDAVPERPPTDLPTQDLSGVAVAAPANAGTGNGTGTGAGIGSGPGDGTGGAGTGQGPAVIHYDYSPVKEKYRPPVPPYPPMAKLARIQGTVSIEITVGVDGVPIAAHATEGPMQLRQAAEAYALKWRFEPVKGNGVPVIGTWPLKVMYQLR